MWNQKASAPLEDSIQIPIAKVDRARVKALAKALDKKEGTLGREILLSSLDSISPSQAQELLADYLSLKIDAPHLYLASDGGLPIIFVGTLDTDGHFIPPEGQDEEDWADFGHDACEEARRQIEAAGEFWHDADHAVLKWAYNDKSDDWREVLVQAAERAADDWNGSLDTVIAFADAVIAGFPASSAWYCLRPDLCMGEARARWSELSSAHQAEVLAEMDRLGVQGMLIDPATL